jgi:hypothetical protein
MSMYVKICERGVCQETTNHGNLIAVAELEVGDVLELLRGPPGGIRRGRGRGRVHFFVCSSSLGGIPFRVLCLCLRGGDTGLGCWMLDIRKTKRGRHKLRGFVLWCLKLYVFFLSWCRSLHSQVVPPRFNG